MPPMVARVLGCAGVRWLPGVPDGVQRLRRRPRGALTEDQVDFNNMLQFYRGRNEHLVAAVKNGRNALDTKWRGSFLGLAAVLRIVVHMVTLQERMQGPRYECFGPWPVCPDSIVRRYV